MKTTGLFTTHRVEVECELNKPFKIIPFGDVHRDSNMHCSDYWGRFLDHAKRQDNALFLGMGDYTDGCSTSERIVLNSPALHETTTANFQKAALGVAETLADELEFMRGKLIGMLGGNHYFQFNSGDTTDHILSAHLGTKFLGVCSFIRLSVLLKDRPACRHCIDIFAHHGLGGGRLAGSTFNTVERMQSVAEADIYLMGHDHNLGCIPAKSRLVLTKGSTEGELNVRSNR